MLPSYGLPGGAITDDTQMSLATANGILAARTGCSKHEPRLNIYAAYLGWLQTQSIPGESRAPGGTCLSALRSGCMGVLDSKRPINDSKGCGGVMRSAPIGLVYSIPEAFQHGCASGAITHGHVDGWLPAGALAALVSCLAGGYLSLSDAFNTVQDIILSYGFRGWAHVPEGSVPRTLTLLNRAWSMAACTDEIHTEETIRNLLGEGWTGDECLALALYFVARFPGEPVRALLACVNQVGDRDSNGAVCGAILGALYGWEWIPQAWLDVLERREELETAAHALAGPA